MSALPTSSPTVDLSRLPAPEIVEQIGFDPIFAAMVADLQARLPTFDATVDSDPVVKVLQVAAYRELLLRQQFNDRARQLLVAYATGGNLDHLGALFGVPRFLIAAADAVTGAAAVYEDDEAFRQRIVLSPEGLSVAGPELAYVSNAKGAAADVLDASAISPTPGDVLVSVLSRVGNGAAAPALVATVGAALTASTVRPLTDRVTVASATVRNFAITARLFTFSGPDAGLVVQAAIAALAGYLADNRKLGRDITLSGLYAALTVAGVQRVALDAPVADIVCDPTQAAWATAIAVTHGGYAD